MIYLFYSEIEDAAFKKAEKLFNDLRVKKPDASFAILDDEHFSENLLEEAFSSAGLFEKKTVLWLKGVIENEEFAEIISAKLEDLKNSENICIVSAKRANVKIVEKIKKVSEKSLVEFEKKNKASGFSVFSLTNALRMRDKKNLWVLYHDALDNGESTEAIQGILFWQVKGMLQAAIAKDVGETDLKPFSYTQSKQGLKNFSKEELQKMALDLTVMYHDAHLGKCDFEIKLEEFILSI